MPWHDSAIANDKNVEFRELWYKAATSPKAEVRRQKDE